MNNPYDFYSNNGLNRIYNNFGLKNLYHRINIPDADLGIGFAEYTAGLEHVNYQPTMRLNVPSSVEDVEDTFTTIGTGGLNVDSFPVGTYYGDAVGVL